MIITTVHGTKFRVDFDFKTWERLDKTGDSGNLRSESGMFSMADTPKVGRCFTMLCPPFLANGPTRVIQTSPIATIEE